MNLSLLLILIGAIVLAVFFFGLAVAFGMDKMPRAATISTGCSLLLLAAVMLFMIWRLMGEVTRF